MKQVLIAALAFTASVSFAAEPIEGAWRTPGGQQVEATRCDQQLCLTLTTGDYAARQIGLLTGTGLYYRGTVTDPTDNKTYSGNAAISTNQQTLKLQGCVLKIFCKSQTWTRIPANDK